MDVHKEPAKTNTISINGSIQTWFLGVLTTIVGVFIVKFNTMSDKMIEMGAQASFNAEKITALIESNNRLSSNDATKTLQIQNLKNDIQHIRELLDSKGK